MTESEHLSTFKTYQAAFSSSVGTDERKRLLDTCVAPNCAYTDPAFECRGHAELVKKIEHSAQHFPGASFRIDDFLEHHGQGLAHWTMFDGAGTEFAKGTSYVRFGADGKLTHMNGFFKAPAGTFKVAS